MKNNAFLHSIAASTILLILSISAFAEVVGSTGDLQKNKRTGEYIFSPEMFQTMRSIGAEWDKKLSLMTECKSEYTVKPMGVMVLAPINFPQDKEHPVMGDWQIRYQLARCGEVKVYNVSFSANSNGKMPNIRPDYPGLTLANPQLFFDTTNASKLAASYKSGSKDTCSDIEIFDTRVSEPSHSVVKEGKPISNVWNEVWTFNVCGKKVEVPITFIPDAGGRGVRYEIRAK